MSAPETQDHICDVICTSALFLAKPEFLIHSEKSTYTRALVSIVCFPEDLKAETAQGVYVTGYPPFLLRSPLQERLFLRVTPLPTGYQVSLLPSQLMTSISAPGPQASALEIICPLMLSYTALISISFNHFMLFSSMRIEILFVLSR